MAEKKQPRTDRRTIYTKNVIKDTVLSMLKTQPFDRLTVAALCRQAEITRTTFYSHYSDLSAVVGELVDDALEISHSAGSGKDYLTDLRTIASATTLDEIRANKNLFPACQRVADNEKYLPLLLDDTLSAYVIQKIYLSERHKMAPIYMEYGHLSEKDAYLLFLHDIYGTFYMNRAMRWKKDDQWYRVHGLISRSFLGALDKLHEEPLK